MVPVGRNNEMALNSNWPHPGFMGNYLPVKHKIGDSGFQANWRSELVLRTTASWFSRVNLLR